MTALMAALYLIPALLLAWLAGRLMAKWGLPDFIGMLLVGIAAAPYLPPIASAEAARNFALIVILLRAGLGIDRAAIRRIGYAAARMGSLPCLLEGALITLVAPQLLPLSYAEALCLAFVLAAVSPAVIVPAMLDFAAKGIGRKRQVPTLVMSAASLDDVFALTLFSAALAALGSGDSIDTSDLGALAVAIPLRSIAGIASGLLIGWLLQRCCKTDIALLLATLLCAGLLYYLEKLAILPITSLLGIMAIGFYLNEHAPRATELAHTLGGIWNWAKLLLFFFIGAAVDLGDALDSGLMGAAIILVGLAGRSLGVWLSLLRSELSKRERLFCLLAYLPKATVQAAIGAVVLTLVSAGSIQLSQGVATGQLILNIAVLSILLTAPLGAILIAKLGPKLLK